MFRWLDNIDVSADNPHADGTGDSTNEEEFSPAELIDQEKKPDNGHDSFDDTENTGHDIHSVRSDTKTLEKS